MMLLRQVIPNLHAHFRHNYYKQLLAALIIQAAKAYNFIILDSK